MAQADKPENEECCMGVVPDHFSNDLADFAYQYLEARDPLDKRKFARLAAERIQEEVHNRPDDMGPIFSRIVRGAVIGYKKSSPDELLKFQNLVMAHLVVLLSDDKNKEEDGQSASLPDDEKEEGEEDQQGEQVELSKKSRWSLARLFEKRD